MRRFQTGAPFISSFLMLPAQPVQIQQPLFRLVIKIRLFHRTLLAFFLFVWSVDGANPAGPPELRRAGKQRRDDIRRLL